MPKYYGFKVCGYYLYYTASCVIEAMHVHASDRRLTEAGSAKFFVYVIVNCYFIVYCFKQCTYFSLLDQTRH